MEKKTKRPQQKKVDFAVTLSAQTSLSCAGEVATGPSATIHRQHRRGKEEPGVVTRGGTVVSPREDRAASGEQTVWSPREAAVSPDSALCALDDPAAEIPRLRRTWMVQIGFRSLFATRRREPEVGGQGGVTAASRRELRADYLQVLGFPPCRGASSRGWRSAGRG